MSCHHTSEAFNVFYESWLESQQSFLNQLIKANQNNTLNNTGGTKNVNGNGHYQLIEQVLSHYGEYYEEKDRIMFQDVFLLFSPPWLTSFEKTFLWVGGFKPSMTFCLVQVSKPDMVSEQFEKLNELKAETLREERKLMDALATVQEAIGSHPLSKLKRREEMIFEREMPEFTQAMWVLRQSMIKVVQGANNLRKGTVRKVMEMLSVNQQLRFLIVVAKYQLWVRAWGVQASKQFDVQRK